MGLQRTAATGLTKLRGFFGIKPQFRHIVETPLETPKKVQMEGGFCFRELVVVPLSVFAGYDQSGAAQISQVTRCCGLWNVEDIHEISHAQLALR